MPAAAEGGDRIVRPAAAAEVAQLQRSQRDGTPTAGRKHGVGGAGGGGIASCGGSSAQDREPAPGGRSGVVVKGTTRLYADAKEGDRDT